MTTRSQIRTAAKAAVSGAYAGEIITKRSNDARDNTEYLRIYIDSGETETNVQAELTTAQLIIEYNKSDSDSDDDLDTVMIAVHQDFMGNFASQISSAGSTDGVGFQWVGFEYGDEQESAFSSLAYTYQLQY